MTAAPHWMIVLDGAVRNYGNDRAEALDLLR
jgi:hypothetical protein